MNYWVLTAIVTAFLALWKTSDQIRKDMHHG
jgi:hypothetical protein